MCCHRRQQLIGGALVMQIIAISSGSSSHSLFNNIEHPINENNANQGGQKVYP